MLKCVFFVGSGDINEACAQIGQAFAKASFRNLQTSPRANGAGERNDDAASYHAQYCLTRILNYDWTRAVKL